MNLSSNVVVITGAGSGMGKEAALRHAKSGNKVVGVDINEKGLQQLAQQDSNIEYRVVDIVDYQAVEQVVANIESEVGAISRLINCAGIMPLNKIAVQEVSVVKKIMDVNYMGTVHMVKAVLPSMQRRKKGDIINFGSTAAYIPAFNYGAYNASKFAVLAFTEVLHHELKDSGIQVTCVCPSSTNTPMLNEATNLPGSTTYFGVYEIETILDAMDASVKRGDLVCIPGVTPKIFVKLRNVAPGLTWKIMDFFDKRLDVIRPTAHQ